jgi:hypothetical protein
VKKSTRRATALAIVLLSAGVAAAPGMPNFHPVPPVLVIHSTAPAGTNGTILLQNDDVADVTVASITRAPSCDPEVTATVPTGPPFTVTSLTAVPMTVHCSGAPMTGMKRCLFHVNDGVGSAYFDAEGVCEYGQMPSLGPTSSSINFGNVTVGGSAMVGTAVHNNSPTTITELYFQTTDIDGNFKIGMPCNPDARECDAAISGVSMGSDASFVVKCTPQTAGLHTASLYVATNSAQYAMPPILLSCNGVSSSNPVLALTGSPIDIGEIEVISATGSGAVHLRNAGGGTLRRTGPTWRAASARGRCRRRAT